jgi:hypothetical protein
MYKVWRFHWRGERREIVFTAYWVRPSRAIRLNGGGYTYGADPYNEVAIGWFRFRRYIKHR